MQLSSNMSHVIFVLFLVPAIAMAAGCDSGKQNSGSTSQQSTTSDEHAFMVVNPGHFHAALVFKRAGYDDVSDHAYVYAPVSEDYNDHMARVIPFNTRSEDPASWTYTSYLGPDYKGRMLEEGKGDIVITSGKNDDKIETILASVKAGYNVLSDKPWVIDPDKYPLLEQALDTAEEKGLVAYDMMTERYEITTILQKHMVAHEPLFGELVPGTPDEPAVIKSSVHHLFKYVAGRPLKRPWWFFDTSVQGEGLVDITTHLVDLMFTTLYPGEAISIEDDITMKSADHWPTVLTEEQFESITKKEFPPQLDLDSEGNLQYYCNGSVVFGLNGINCKAEVIWNYKAPEGTGDTHYSIIKGSKAHLLILQGEEQDYNATLYVKPAPDADAAEIEKELRSFIDGLAASDFPGLGVTAELGMFRIDIPDKYHVGHEAHFGQVTDQFLSYLEGEPMPDWEKPNMLAKYYITTEALKMARESE